MWPHQFIDCAIIVSYMLIIMCRWNTFTFQTTFRFRTMVKKDTSLLNNFQIIAKNLVLIKIAHRHDYALFIKDFCKFLSLGG